MEQTKAELELLAAVEGLDRVGVWKLVDAFVHAQMDGPSSEHERKMALYHEKLFNDKLGNVSKRGDAVERIAHALYHHLQNSLGVNDAFIHTSTRSIVESEAVRRLAIESGLLKPEETFTLWPFDNDPYAQDWVSESAEPGTSDIPKASTLR